MTDQPADQPSTEQPSHEHVTDDHGDALRRSAASIKEAQDAEGVVAGHDDITTLDAQRAGELSEDPDGSGGHP